MIENELNEMEFLRIKKNILKIRKRIEEIGEELKIDCSKIKLMAVVKNVKLEMIEYAIDSGVKLIGENRAQELNERFEFYKQKKVEVHFIGHLQTNKVKSVVEKVNMIESVDSVKLASLISEQAIKLNKSMPILIEINVANEKNKFGFSFDDVFENLIQISKMSGVKINGLMTVLPKNKVQQYFQKIQNLYIDISNKKIDNVEMRFLSMGMSSDFEEAVKYGSNIVRIGRSIFESLN